MSRATPWRRWGRTTLLGVVAAIATWFAFGAHTPVPLFDWFDLGVHEAGHLLAFPLPDIAMFMAGSFAQIAFPLAMAWYFGIRRGDRAAGGFCLVWAGTSAWDVSVYAADAVTQQLPLVGGGQHDWAYILGHFDALHRTADVARGIEAGGMLLAIAGLVVLALQLFPLRVPKVEPHLVAVPTPVPLAADDDPWVAAGRLPFRHEPASR